MKKGFVRTLEVFLAITLIYVIITNVQMQRLPAYDDPNSMQRLQRYAADISLSVCNNENQKMKLINDELEVNFTNQLPNDLQYAVQLYTNSTDNHLLDNLINETGVVENKIAATASCLTSGYFNTAPFSQCDYAGDCRAELEESDDSKLDVTENENFTLYTEGPAKITKATLTLETMHSAAGNTSIYYYNGTDTIYIANYSFSASADETTTLDLTSYLTNGIYNITVNPSVNASYDYATLLIESYYPKKIVTAVWSTR